MFVYAVLYFTEKIIIPLRPYWITLIKQYYHHHHYHWHRCGSAQRGTLIERIRAFFDVFFSLSCHSRGTFDGNANENIEKERKWKKNHSVFICLDITSIWIFFSFFCWVAWPFARRYCIRTKSSRKMYKIFFYFWLNVIFLCSFFESFEGFFFKAAAAVTATVIICSFKQALCHWHCINHALKLSL